MKKIYYVILLLLIILINLLFLLLFSVKKENFDNIKVDIGNELTVYFFELGKCILQKKNFEYSKLVTNENSNINEHFFFKSLPSFIEYDFDDIYNSFHDHGLTYENVLDKVGDSYGGLTTFELVSNDRYYFWISMKPIVNKILNNTFETSGLKRIVNNPIIHFRCSDTPFLRYSGYHLQYYSFFKEALQLISSKLNKEIHEVDIMSCVSHKSDELQQKSCNTYASSLKEYLNNLGYKTNIICNSNIDDFANLFYSPAVITIGGSFSFIAGFFSNGIFISTEADKGKLCDVCKDFVLYEYNLPHEDVKDYNDTNDVVTLLNQKS